MQHAPRPRLTHFALFVSDIEKMAKFYTHVLGLTVTDQGTFTPKDQPVQMVFLSSDPQEHHQFVLITGRPADVNFSLNQQMSFILGNLDELRELNDRVENSGVANIRTVTHGNAWSIYFKDPEDNQIELYVHTPWYVPQPHAHPLDLAMDNDKILAVTEQHCRADPGFMMATEREAEMAKKMGLTA